MKPLCVDLYCGLGGWTEGFLAEDYDVVGVDIEEHVYGDQRYPADLILQDVRTLHGRQFKHASIIVASSPCQKYSYMAMPWLRAKELAKWYRDPLHPERLVELNELFDQPKRIQREASEAAGHHIPMIQENVRGAQPWVGKAQWHYGSFYLWGDIPALMPVPVKAVKVGGFSWSDFGKPGYVGKGFNHEAEREYRGLKNTGGSWFAIPGPGGITANNNPDGRKVPSESGRRIDVGKGARFTSRDCGVEGIKQPGLSGMRANGKGDRWFQDGAAASGSKSSARKAAAARIAKIPFPLAQHIARVTREARKVA